MHDAEELKFGRFQLRRRQRQLMSDGAPVELGGRAFDILLTLIDADGEPVGKDTLIDRVWAGAAVEEQNLTVQIHALRKMLGDDHHLIRTVARHGYSFTGKVEMLTRAAANTEAVIALPKPVAATNIPAPVEALIGRDHEVEELLDLRARCRLLTLTGPGGIGKTQLALEVARRLLPSFSDGVWLVELATLADAVLVPVTIASVLGLQIGASARPMEAIASALAGKNLLLVLDNCEHLIADAARAAEILLHSSPGVQVLATCREPLRAEGETVYRVPGLTTPAASVTDADEIMRHTAVQLFVARAAAAGERSQIDNVQLATIAAICRRLDGIPLALELAAARAALGLVELLGGLDDRFVFLTGGRRTALPRHQTLRATLDWSYELLPEAERAVLRRLAVFAGGFTFPAARSVVGDAGPVAVDTVTCVANLVTKSLVAADGGTDARLRLLETTRTYALEKLTEMGELESAARRHAEFLRDLFERAEAEHAALSVAEWLAAYGRWIDDVRAALDWAFSPGGDATVGVALTAASEGLWCALTLMQECCTRVERALSSLHPDADGATRCEMQLYAALGGALFATRGPGHEAGAAWTKVLAVAEKLDDADYRLRALWGLWRYRNNNGERRLALSLAQRFCDLASRLADPSIRPIGERLLGASLHYQGDQANARRLLEPALNQPASKVRVHSIVVRFQFDQRVLACNELQRVLWLQGFPVRAMQMAGENVEDATALDHVISLCSALLAACETAIAVGDLAAADRYLAMLLKRSEELALVRFLSWGHCFEAELSIRRGHAAAGVQRLRVVIDKLHTVSSLLKLPSVLSTLAEGLVAVGGAAEGLAAIDEALAQCVRSDTHWNEAELLRIKGELLLLRGAAGAAAAAEDHFRRSLDLARRQSALSWELRTAMSLARAQRDPDRYPEARELLASVYGRFSEGFASADLRAARQLLDTFPRLSAQPSNRGQNIRQPRRHSSQG